MPLLNERLLEFLAQDARANTAVATQSLIMALKYLKDGHSDQAEALIQEVVTLLLPRYDHSAERHLCARLGLEADFLTVPADGTVPTILPLIMEQQISAIEQERQEEPGAYDDLNLTTLKAMADHLRQGKVEAYKSLYNSTCQYTRQFIPEIIYNWIALRD